MENVFLPNLQPLKRLSEKAEFIDYNRRRYGTETKSAQRPETTAVRKQETTDVRRPETMTETTTAQKHILGTEPGDLLKPSNNLDTIKTETNVDISLIQNFTQKDNILSPHAISFNASGEEEIFDNALTMAEEVNFEETSSVTAEKVVVVSATGNRPEVPFFPPAFYNPRGIHQHAPPMFPPGDLFPTVPYQHGGLCYVKPVYPVYKKVNGFLTMSHYATIWTYLSFSGSLSF